MYWKMMDKNQKARWEFFMDGRLGHLVEFTVDDDDYLPLTRQSEDDSLNVTAVGLANRDGVTRPFLVHQPVFQHPKIANKVVSGIPGFKRLRKGPRKGMIVQEKFASPEEKPQSPRRIYWLDEIMSPEHPAFKTADDMIRAGGRQTSAGHRSRVWWPEIFAEIRPGQFPTGVQHPDMLRLRKLDLPDMSELGKDVRDAVRQAIGYGVDLGNDLVRRFAASIRFWERDGNRVPIANIKFFNVPSSAWLLSDAAGTQPLQVIRAKPGDLDKLKGRAGKVYYNLTP